MAAAAALSMAALSMAATAALSMAAPMTKLDFEKTCEPCRLCFETRPCTPESLQLASRTLVRVDADYKWPERAILEQPAMMHCHACCFAGHFSAVERLPFDLVDRAQQKEYKVKVAHGRLQQGSVELTLQDAQKPDWRAVILRKPERRDWDLAAYFAPSLAASTGFVDRQTVERDLFGCRLLCTLAVESSFSASADLPADRRPEGNCFSLQTISNEVHKPTALRKVLGCDRKPLYLKEAKEQMQELHGCT